jgi:membrane-associated phospholipid phosphatase
MIAFLSSLDLSIFYFINQKIANPVFDWLMPVITNQWYWAVPILLIWLGMLIFGNKRTRIAGLLILLTVATTDPICAQILKPTFKRVRPSRALTDVRLLVKRGGKYGFPSNHAANVTGAMAILIFFFRRYKYAFLTTAVLVSLSRVYVGVHYPFDVLLGMTIGIFFAALWLIIWLTTANHLAKSENYLLTISK